MMPHHSHRSSVQRWTTLTLAIAASVLGCLSCTRYPKLEPREPHSGGSPPDLQAPIILVGQLLSNEALGRPYAPEWDRYIKIQEYRVRVAVERIFRGNITEREVPIYYFGYISNVGGPPHLGMRANGGHWQLGDSIIFFLEPERGALRTICDFHYYCATQVFTGVHPNFKVDPKQSLGCSIAELLLSRGPNTTDLQMARAILDNKPRVFSDSCTRQKLKSWKMTQVWWSARQQSVWTKPLRTARARCAFLAKVNLTPITNKRSIGD